MKLKIGITGGIGSGKSTICEVFRLLGIPVFEADKVAKNLLNENQVIKNGLIHLFGNDIYTAENTVDRKKLASIIFNDDIQLQNVNKLVHPAVREEFQNWFESQDAPYVIHEAAILFESGFYKMMDYTILVTAPESERITRVANRDGLSEKMILERMKKQWDDNKKRDLATVELVNDNKNLLIPEIIEIDKNLKKYGKIW